MLGASGAEVFVGEVGDNIVQTLTYATQPEGTVDTLHGVLIRHLVGEFRQQHGVDLGASPGVLPRLREGEAAERALYQLSSASETVIQVPCIGYKSGSPLHLESLLRRNQLETLLAPLATQTLKCCKRALDDAHKNPAKIDQILVGGDRRRIPLPRRSLEELFGKRADGSTVPEEMAVIGAATQAAVLSGHPKDTVLLDASTRSLGVETQGDTTTIMIGRNTTIPTQKVEVFSTATDSQPSVEIHILEGEAAKASSNRSLGRFHLEGIPPAARGVPKIEVTFRLDPSDELAVSAEDIATGKKLSVGARE